MHKQQRPVQLKGNHSLRDSMNCGRETLELHLWCSTQLFSNPLRGLQRDRIPIGILVNRDFEEGTAQPTILENRTSKVYIKLTCTRLR
jgi:hypothetical protein